jgi:hypothetical protein
MNSEQIQGIIRAILAAIGGFILAKGWVNAETWAWIVGGLSTVGPVIWTWFGNRPAAQAAAAQRIEGVNVQVAPSAPDAVKTAVADAKAAGN